MAELLLARTDGPHGFSKLVALKRIRPELADDDQFVRMFLDEARLAATLHHPNVVQVFDIGEEAGAFFIAMEYLEGEDLRSLMQALRARKEILALDEALAICIGVCAGLHYAHERVGDDGKPLEIVHRDVSPQNVVVTWDGGVKVVDFGIARAARRATETRQGTLKGKIEYMSPEQGRGMALDRRSDVFAIGILLWELTCGKRLYAGASDYEVLKRIVERPAPAPSTVLPEYPRELEEILVRALEREPARRWPTAQALQRALEAFAREQRLDLSPVRLGARLRGLFVKELSAWNEARTRGGEALERYAETRAARIRAESEVTDVDDTAATTPGSLERPGTRAVGARRRRAMVPLLGAGVATVLVAVGAAAWMARGHGGGTGHAAAVHANRSANANGNANDTLRLRAADGAPRTVSGTGDANGNVSGSGDANSNAGAKERANEIAVPRLDGDEAAGKTETKSDVAATRAPATVEHPTAHTRDAHPIPHHSHVTRPPQVHPSPAPSRTSTPAPPLRPPPAPPPPPRRAADLDAPLPPSP